MKTWKLFWLIVKRVHGDKIIYGFLLFYLAASAALWILDPGITNLQDGLWLGFNIATSIGLGDFTVKTAAARLVAAALGLYGALIAAVIPGLIASYYIEKVSLKAGQAIEQHYDELMNLHQMSPEEKARLAQTIRKEHAQ
ncbi:MAG: hypothetical protein HUJ54_07750 [Erysipelotrichaceae bacterium]|nr:hypothetical protein [Erysipelotrichaceae bacterium]